MCGIFGYIGPKNASEVILEGLKRLEYRGYDSWGIAVVADQLRVNKKVGSIGDLNRSLDLPNSTIGIGHTRWATHGGISETNAHPHFSSDKSFLLAQNGIVENYAKLKSDLFKKGYKFKTETDTEVIVRLIEDKLKSTKNLKEAIRLAFLDLDGRNTIIILTKDGKIIAARDGSPLVLGVTDSEIFFSSDTLSFAPIVDKVVVVENEQLVYSDGKVIEIENVKTKKQIPFKAEKINFESSKVDKEGYDHFMQKEIHESPYVINQVISQASHLENFAKVIKKAKNIPYQRAVAWLGYLESFTYAGAYYLGQLSIYCSLAWNKSNWEMVC